MTATGVEFLPHFADAPALGVLELSSIARGVQVADAVVKRAPSTLLLSRPVSGSESSISGVPIPNRQGRSVVRPSFVAERIRNLSPRCIGNTPWRFSMEIRPSTCMRSNSARRSGALP